MGTGVRLLRAAGGALMLLGAVAVAWRGAGAPAWAQAVVVAVGCAAAGMLGVAVLSAPGRVRLTWTAGVVAVPLWTAALVGILRGWPSWLSWGVLRGSACIVVAVGALVMPGVWRRGRDLAMLLLDGWLVGASAVLIAWVLVARDESNVDHMIADLPAAFLWAGIDLVFVVIAGGLVVRTQRNARGAALVLVVVALLCVAADIAWAHHPDPHVGTGLWLAMITFLSVGAASVIPAASPTFASPDDIQLGRPSHLAVVPALLAAAVASHANVVTIGLAVSLVLGLAGGITITSRDMKALWRLAWDESRRLDAVLRGSLDAIVRLDAEGVVEYANPACAAVFGHPPETLVGHRLVEYAAPEDLAEARRAAGSYADGGGTRFVQRFRRRDGQCRHLEVTVNTHPYGHGRKVVIARDVEERHRLEAELRRQASTDPLTGLLNRQAFLSELEERLVAGPVAVLFADLDEFKSVNDTRGHGAGDELLVRVARGISVTAGPERRVARLGGDEFAVLVPLLRDHDLTPAEDLACDLAERLGGADGAEAVRLSIGVAPGHGWSAEEVLGDADLAMYEAKAAGGGRAVVFEPELRERVLARSRLRADLERVVTEGGLGLDLQPIVELSTGRWVGFEALVRWPDGERRRLPAEFVPLAEETGIIVPLGAWVLSAALEWLASWPDASAGVSVNVAGKQVAEPGFADFVLAELCRTGIDPGRLTLEITEQTAVEDLGRAGAVLQPLRSIGVHVALDDFGTGFSSLGYLAQLPVDELKIDRKFVSGLGRREEDDVLVRAVLSLASDLGLQVVAEGVETPEQAVVLRGYACPLVQGYLYARPVPHTVLRPPAEPSRAAPDRARTEPVGAPGSRR